jgi:hypothetical protein
VARISSRRLDELGVQVDRLEQLVDRLGAHAGVELVAVLLEASRYCSSVSSWPRSSGGHARIDDDVGFEVQDALDVAQRHVEHQADARRQRLQEPDVRDRAGQLDVAHALAAHLGLRDLDAALLADHAAVLQRLYLPHRHS